MALRKSFCGKGLGGGSPRWTIFATGSSCPRKPNHAPYYTVDLSGGRTFGRDSASLANRLWSLNSRETAAANGCGAGSQAISGHEFIGNYQGFGLPLQGISTAPQPRDPGVIYAWRVAQSR